MVAFGGRDTNSTRRRADERGPQHARTARIRPQARAHAYEFGLHARGHELGLQLPLTRTNSAKSRSGFAEFPSEAMAVSDVSTSSSLNFRARSTPASLTN